MAELILYTRPPLEHLISRHRKPKEPNDPYVGYALQRSPIVCWLCVSRGRPFPEAWLANRKQAGQFRFARDPGTTARYESGPNIRSAINVMRKKNIKINDSGVRPGLWEADAAI